MADKHIPTKFVVFAEAVAKLADELGMNRVESQIAVLRELRAEFYGLAINFDDPGSMEKVRAIDAAIDAAIAAEQGGRGEK